MIWLSKVVLADRCKVPRSPTPRAGCPHRSRHIVITRHPWSDVHKISSVVVYSSHGTISHRHMAAVLLLHIHRGASSQLISRSYWGSAIGIIMCLSVCFVCLWRCALWLNDTSYIQQKCLNNCLRKCPLEKRFYNTVNHSLHLPYPLQLPISWTIDVGAIWRIN